MFIAGALWYFLARPVEGIVPYDFLRGIRLKFFLFLLKIGIGW